MNRRRWLLTLPGLLVSAGCASPGSKSLNSRNTGGNNGVSVVDTVLLGRRLRAGFVVYPPFVYRDPNSGKLSGYFIDLMAEIARYGDFTIDYREEKWGSMVAALESGAIDVVVSGIFPTIPRSFSVAFARPVMFVGLSALVSASSPLTENVQDLTKPGLRIAVVNGEVGHEYARRFLPQTKLTVLDTADISRAAVEVLERRADIAIAESITLVQFAAAHPETRVMFTDKPLQVFGSTLMVRRGDPDWVQFLNTSIDFLEASGRLDQLQSRYKKEPRSVA